MMHTLIQHEFIVQNKLYNTIKYNIIFFIFCNFTITLINTHQNIGYFGMVFSVVTIPLALMNLSYVLIKSDVGDGTLELLLTSCSAFEIIISKYIALSVLSMISFIAVMPYIYYIYNLTIIPNLMLIFYTGILLLMLSSAIIVLISAMQAYFRTNTNFLSVLIMPLIIPNIILSGIVIQDLSSFYLLYVICGINLFVIPIALYCASYLIENIFN